MIDYTKESKLNVKSAVEKLNVEFDDYVIFDVCNPGLAHALEKIFDMQSVGKCR